MNDQEYIEQYKNGRQSCIDFYKTNCCQSVVMPSNPQHLSDAENRGFNAGWNSYIPDCNSVCKKPEQMKFI